VLGERTAAGAKHLVPGPQRRHLGPDRLDTPGHIPAEERVLWRADAEASKAHRVWHPRQQMPDALVDACGDPAQQHLTLARDRRGDLAEPQNVNLPVPVADDRLHRLLPGLSWSSRLRTASSCLPTGGTRSGLWSDNGSPFGRFSG